MIALSNCIIAIMRFLLRIIFAFTLMIAGGADVMAIEEAQYIVREKEGKFEVRDYSPHILAETIVEGDLEDAGSNAFNRLFQYISGNNQIQAKVDMTAPVSQKSESKKIAMTAPVGQQRTQEQWAVSFMMPASYTIEILPEPLDPKISLREVPARTIAAVRYSGFWSEKGYLKNKSELESWIAKKGLKIVGEPIWARYNSPFSLWFLRRNEVLIPVTIE
jgi:effector-binding domain-containing protein